MLVPGEIFTDGHNRRIGVDKQLNTWCTLLHGTSSKAMDSGIVLSNFQEGPQPGGKRFLPTSTAAV
jgi:hypothetical protein